MNRKRTGEKYYAILKLKERAPINLVIKNYFLGLKKAKSDEEQKEICFAFCKICNSRQVELYRYIFQEFLQNYQSLTIKQMQDIVNKIIGKKGTNYENND